MTKIERKEKKIQEEKDFIQSLKNRCINGTEKENFRKTSVWKFFRKKFYIKEIITLKNGKKREIKNVDYLTQNPLQIRFNLHHEDLNSEHYTELKEENFIPLNPKSHEAVHWFYTQYCKDKDFEKRFLEIIHKMYELNDGKDVKDFK